MSQCIDTKPVLACFTPTDTAQAPVTVLEHIIYEQGRAIGQAYTTADDVLTPIDPATFLGGGTISAGSCPVAQPDVEWEKLCDDVNGDGTLIVPFFCRTITTFDATGAATTTVANFELDKVTAYTPVGTVACCSECERCGDAGLITSWADLCPAPPVPFFADVARACALYTQLGSNYTFGPSGFLENPALFDDPPPPGSPSGFDFTCTNHYPIVVHFDDAAYSTDGGATWTHFAPADITYNSLADVNFRDDGFGLGWSDWVDAINPFIIPQGIQAKVAASTIRWEYQTGLTEATHMVRVSWQWQITGGNCEGVDGFDPFEKEWTDEWQFTATDGQSYGRGDGLGASPDDVESAATIFVPPEFCIDV